jgi:hypothetical protein
MKDISKILLRFLKQFSTKTQTPPPISWSPKAKAFLKTLYKEIDHAQKQWNAEGSKSMEKTAMQHIVGNQFRSHSDQDYAYIPQEIRTLIETQTHWTRRFTFTLHNDIYTITMVHPTQDMTERRAQAFFEDSLHKIYLWLFISNLFSSKHCSNQMSITLFFTQHKKVLAKMDMEPLDWVHTNSAFTTSCFAKTNIHIFREEEWFKVLIHETFHNMGLDFSSMDQSQADAAILSFFPVKRGDVRLFETYCELWAEIIHTLFFAMFENPKFPAVCRTMESLFSREIEYTYFQVAKILDHYHTTYQEVIAGRTAKYKENTYILSYYIIKLVLMHQPSLFIEWCLAHNPEILAFRKTQANIRAFCHLIKTQYKDPHMIEVLNGMQTRFVEFSKDAHHMECETMRMTIFA